MDAAGILRGGELDMRDPEADVPHFLRVVRALARVKAPIASLATVAVMAVPASCESGHSYGVVFQPQGAGGAGGFDSNGTSSFNGGGVGFPGTTGEGGFGVFDAGDPFEGGPVGVPVDPDGGDPFDGGEFGIDAGAGPEPDGGP
jgi:hypothetical protein